MKSLKNKNTKKFKKLAYLFLVLFFFSCGSKPSIEKKNVILIIVDTLRVDHLGCYGAKKNISPAIDLLAKKGIQFENAYSTAPWTRPAVASILTGLLPYKHNVCDIPDILEKEEITLSETLQERGYKTAGIISNMLVTSKFGYSQGFDIFNEKNLADYKGITSSKITGDAIKWIDKNKQNNFFLWLHYYDPHYSYQHHPEFNYINKYSGDLKAGDDIWELREKSKKMEKSDINFLLNLYDEEISYTDKYIGNLLDYLKKEELMDNTVIVFTADHGEEFMERGWIGHTTSLYQELVHIPLIVMSPDNNVFKKVYNNVSVVDIVPTILDLLNISYKKSSYDGNSLAQYFSDDEIRDDEKPIYLQVSFAVNEKNDSKKKQKKTFQNGVLVGNWKLINDMLDDKYELYDIENDRDEKNNLIGKELKVEKMLKKSLDKMVLSEEYNKLPNQKNKVILSEKETSVLKSLGYLQ